jgi:hypothetical protein
MHYFSAYLQATMHSDRRLKLENGAREVLKSKANIRGAGKASYSLYASTSLRK